MTLGETIVAKGNLPYVNAYPDRHGRWRYYFRRAGKKIPLPGNRKTKDFSDPAFLRAYSKCLEDSGGLPPEIADKQGSMWHAVQNYYRSTEFLNLAVSTKKEYRRCLTEILKDHGHRPFAQLQRKHIEAIRDSKVVIEDGEVVSGHGAAKNFVNALRGLCKWGVKSGVFDSSPAAGVTLYKTKRSYTRWADEHIEAFKQVADDQVRLALELLVCTGQRRGDVASMTWNDYDGSSIRVIQAKTDEPLWIPCHRDLQAVLQSATRLAVTILVSPTGKSFTSKNLGHRLSEFMDKAGLRAEHNLTVHGLRATAASRLAETGCTDHEIMAITGHKTMRMVQHYTKDVRQKALAERAIAKLEK